MRIYRLNLWVCLLLVVMITSCESTPESTDTATENNETAEPEKESPLEIPKGDGTFSTYLDLFQQTGSYADWPTDIEGRLGKMDAMYAPTLQATLEKLYTPIGESYLPFIPTGKIKNFDPAYTEDIQNPGQAFTFWAARKWDGGQFWLAAIVGIKKERIDAEYHAHPVLLVTYSKEGQVIEDHVWTFFDDDVYQLWDRTEVHGDTLVSGYAPHSEAPAITQVKNKTVIDEMGRFRTVFVGKVDPEKP